MDLGLPAGEEAGGQINNKFSKSLVINTRAPQGCILPPLLNSLYTNECISLSQSVKLFKFADYTTLVGLISNNNFDISITKKVVVDLRKSLRVVH